ncbi:MAG: hypothetical protein NZ959_07835 [Armatimonadetes bacterium]|nr:hypothetical protein [Armatimonadota bacterium]MDW8121911.1 hypothetical protein [Armatimonadota bacterium]
MATVHTCPVLIPLGIAALFFWIRLTSSGVSATRALFFTTALFAGIASGLYLMELAYYTRSAQPIWSATSFIAGISLVAGSWWSIYRTLRQRTPTFTNYDKSHNDCSNPSKDSLQTADPNIESRDNPQ